MPPSVLPFALVAATGAAVMLAAVVAARRGVAPDLDEFLGELELFDEGDPRPEPFVRRVVIAPMVRHIDGLLPRTYMGTMEKLLAQAGLAGKRTAGQQLALQLGCAIVGGAAATLVLLSGASSGLAVGLLLLPVIGFMVPSARLKRAVRHRTDLMFKDLPDMIDMLAIAVEAGSGFEAALSLICEHFRSPMADDLALALNAMSLGMPRRQALQDLKERTDLDVVRTFALALIQADALGIPISRVLRAQANEIRARRRAWAREKAAKMPVKILFPLVLFIFPPILAIVVGPAALSLAHQS